MVAASSRLSARRSAIETVSPSVEQPWWASTTASWSRAASAAASAISCDPDGWKGTRPALPR